MNRTVKKAFVTAMAAAGLVVATPATPAFAVGVVDCGTPVIDEYTRVSSNFYPWSTCFANAGAMNISIYETTDFHTGNNKVTFFYTVEENNYQNALTLEKWQDHGLAFGFHAHVTSVVIW
ncbi:beta/gamma crystallin domain-containing protein [Streptomyces sp. NPDC017248]|uniref:beta/gamma crystallin domain-containing protein n=1 Tax=unclassified Streptomyces TaxID=2593676 RepID=UPI00379581FB